MTEAVPATRRLHLLLHAQALTGVGHYVRMREIARALAVRHEVHLLQAGRPVPGELPAGVMPLALPALERHDRRLQPLEDATDITSFMAQRRERLCAAIAALCPDLLVIEHFPFSKWELEEEITAAVAEARAQDPRVRIVCSVRDIPRQTSHEACSAGDYTERVLDTLQEQFDAVLVHGDPALTRLEEHFPGVARLRLPVSYTGIVCGPAPTAAECSAAAARLTGGAPFVLASAGGGPDTSGLLAHCVQAWQRPELRAVLAGNRLVLAAGLRGDLERLRALVPETLREDILVRAFSAEYRYWLGAARLSVSCAGYNTCADLLQRRCAALLVPNAAMSDQPERARLLAARGLVKRLSPDALTPATLAQAMLEALSHPMPEHTVDLEGTANCVAAIEQLAG